MNVQTPAPPTVDLTAIKGAPARRLGLRRLRHDRHHAADRGRKAMRGRRSPQNQRVLDVAAGNGNATLAAARRFADVVSTDYVASLLERGRERAEADRLKVTFQQADAEALPFADESFDVVLSSFGVMFTPNQQQAATS
jgi:ubiquinone/menaquinone biosynthesis C-methylase UbiE